MKASNCNLNVDATYEDEDLVLGPKFHKRAAHHVQDLVDNIIPFRPELVHRVDEVLRFKRLHPPVLARIPHVVCPPIVHPYERDILGLFAHHFGHVLEDFVGSGHVFGLEAQRLSRRSAVSADEEVVFRTLMALTPKD